MIETSQAFDGQRAVDKSARRKRTLLAAGGAVGAVLASACCVLPLALVTLGASGAWIGSLTLFDPYKPYIAVVALGLIGAGFRQVYFKPRPEAECGPDGYCARPESTVITQAVLWVATVLVLLALTIGWWAPFFY